MEVTTTGTDPATTTGATTDSGPEATVLTIIVRGQTTTGQLPRTIIVRDI